MEHFFGCLRAHRAESEGPSQPGIALVKPGPHRFFITGNATDFAYELVADRGLRQGRFVVLVSGIPILTAGPQNTEPEQWLEHLIECYQHSGERLVDRLSGGYSLALIDLQEQSILMAIDRLGIKPLYFAASDSQLTFSTSGRAVASSIGAGIDRNAIYEYVYFHCVPSPTTAFEGVTKLEPAQRLTGNHKAVQVSRYWYPPFRKKHRQNKDAIADSLLQRLEAAVANCDVGESGAFLSGGLDSSTVAGLLAKVRTGVAPAYSIGFDEAGYDEMHYAEIAADRFNLRHHKYYVTADDVVSAIPHIASTYDEPFGNSSAVPTLLCARMAKENQTTNLLAGDGGDELFAGNERYARQRLFSVYDRLPRWSRNKVLEPLFLRSLAEIDWLPIRKLRSYVEQARVPMPDRMQTYNFLHRFPAEEIFESEFLHSVDPMKPLELMRSTYDEAPTESVLERMLYLDWKFTLADNDLRKVTAMVESEGISVMFPMLDDGVVDLAAGVDPSWQLRGTELRSFYKYAVRDLLPTEILTKPKHGFGLPFGEWLNQSPVLQDLIFQNLNQLKSRQIVKSDFIDQSVKLNQSDFAGYYGVLVWVLAMLEEWLSANDLQV